MIPVVEALAALPGLRELPEKNLRAVARSFAWLRAGEGDVLWREGEAVDEVGFLWSGELVVDVGGVEVGRLGAGQILGEAGSFVAGAARSATVRAEEPVVLLLLPLVAVRALREQHHPFYEALCDLGLAALEARVRETSGRVQVPGPSRVRVAGGEDDEEPEDDAPTLGRCPPVEPLLRRLNGFADAPAAIVEEVGAAMRRIPLGTGHVVCREGDVGDGLFLVADGTIAVVRGADSPAAQRLAQLGPGSLVGVNTMVRPGLRTATCVGEAPGWLYRLDTGAFARLSAAARLRMREAMIAALAGQLRGSNERVVNAVTRPRYRLTA